MSLKLRTRLDLAGQKAVLTFSGDLTVPHSVQAKAALLEAMSQADSVEIRFEDVADVDLSFLQILCSAHKSSIKARKLLTVLESEFKPFRETLRAVCYLRSTGCVLDQQKQCFWVGH